MKLKVNRGITLIEVLATITISGILFAIIGTIIGTFSVSYNRSQSIRETDKEIQYIENAISLCVEHSNTNGLVLSIKEDLENNLVSIVLVNSVDDAEIEEVELFNYNTVSNTAYLSFSDSTKELKYIKTIVIDDSNKVGIILEITTIENVKQQKYYNVINLKKEE